MTRLELSLPYKELSDRERTGFRIFWALAGVGAGALIFTAHHILSYFGVSPPGWLPLAKFLAFIGGGLAYVYIPYQMATNEAQGTHVFLNQEGLGIPTTFLGIGPGKWLPWQDVKTLEIEAASAENAFLRIGVGNNQFYSLRMASFSREDLEQLLLAAEACAKEAVWSPRLAEYRDNLQNENRGLLGLSYTQLWEEELGRRFTSTTFVPMEPGRALRSGTITVHRQLAFGGFSAVYIAEDQSAGTVVLKESVFASDDVDPIKQKATELFKREAMLLTKLHHPQIARVIDHFTESSRDYLVIERVEGESLRQLVKRVGKQPESKVIAWALQMSGILDYLHSQSPPVLHRDFTPDNLILKDDGSLVLIDFGAANQFLGAVTGTLLGKPAYMAPEQVRGKATPLSDLYALGSTLYFLLVGSDPKTLTVAHPGHETENVSAGLDRLVARLTAYEAADRLSSAQALVRELERLAAPQIAQLAQGEKIV